MSMEPCAAWRLRRFEKFFAAKDPYDVIGIIFKAPTMNECEEARGLRSFAFQKDSNYSKNLLERSV